MPETTIVSGDDFPTSTNANEYDLKKRFVTKQTNSAGHIREMGYDNGYGNILTGKDPNSLVTQYLYDGFGRIKETTTPTNQKVTITRGWDLGTFTNSIYSIQTSQPGTPGSKEYFDLLGKTLRTEIKGFDGSVIFVSKTYNNLGQLLTESEPNGIASSTQYTYETDFKRLKTIASPGGTTATYDYPFGTNTTNTETNAGNIRHSSKTLDASGELVTSTDEGGTLSYLYHSSGNPRQITAPGGVVTTMDYDVFGRQILLNDPDAGIIRYDYDGLGQLLHQQDARQLAANPSYSYTLTYDAIGRVIKKESQQEGNVNYIYDIKAHGKGMLSSIAGFNGINCDYTYDSHSRLASKTEQNIDGNNFAFSYLYDDLNRVKQITYPGGFSVKRNYNTRGYLNDVTDASNNLIWQCNTMNERLQVLTAMQGNGGTISKTYTNLGYLNNVSRTENSSPAMNWDFGFNTKTGNLDNRADNLQFANDPFTYDKLDRLISGVSYLPNGNIVSKADAGNYGYNTTQPHAVAVIGAPSANISSVQQDITYSPFQKTELVTEGNYTLQFTYGYDYQRKMSKLTLNGNTEKKIINIGDYEEITTLNGTYKVHYIAGGDGLAAIYVIPPSGGSGDLYYVHADHLGSILNIYNGSGILVFAQNFDAWGRYRDPQTWQPLPVSAGAGAGCPEWLIRGYTGHEHHPELALVNMNGRMYDPVIGRMLSPDNYVQSSSSTQSFNRFAYAYNNPLIYTDPDGEWVAQVVGGLIGGYSGYKLGEAMGATGLELVGYTLGGAAIGAISGGIGGMVASGGGIAANTMGIVAASFTNSAGMYWMSGGKTDISVGFGAGSYNFSSGELGYLGKKGNSNLENFGYGWGALSNVSDVLAGFHPGEVELNTEHSDAIGHSAITKVGETDPHNSIVSVGPDPGGKWIFNPLKFNKGTNNWKNYVDAGDDVWKNTVKGVNVNTLNKYGAHFNKGIKYNLYFSSCVNHTARALTLSGVPVIGIHPFILNAQIYLRAEGFRPVLYSYYLTK